MAKRKATRSMKRRRVRRKKLVRFRPAAKNTLVTKRFVYRQDETGSGASIFFNGLSFTLGQVPGNAEFTSLFDFYKITGIRYRFVVVRAAEQTGASALLTVGYYPRVMHVIDKNDATAPSNFAELQQYDNVKEDYLTDSKPQSKWYWMKPATTAQAGSTGASEAYNQWFRTTDVNTQYFGLRYYGTELQTGQILRVECVYYMAFKNVK